MTMRPGRSKKAHRAGSLLVCVLVCLGIASIVSLGALRTGLTHRRELQRHWQIEQTQWLLEAGWRRALRAREANDQYTGEDWQLPGVLSDNLDAHVQITIEPVEASPDVAELLVAVTLTTTDPVPTVTRRTRSWRITYTPTPNDLPDNEDSP